MSSNFDQLLDVAKTQTADFKVQYLNLVREDACITYDKLPDRIKSAENKMKSLHERIRNCCKEKRDSCGRLSFADLDLYIAQTSPMRKEVNKFEGIIRQSKKFLQMGKDSFVEANVGKASIMFDGKVYALADKLDKNGFTPDCEFSAISHDPKLFDTIITSGSNKVHARSILAAVGSECMVAHFRFIITNAK